MNKTICERTRCMLSHAKLPSSIWSEAMRTTIDFIDLSLSIPLDDSILKSVWTGKEVSLEHLKVLANGHLSMFLNMRFKLDSNATQYIFLGYAHEEFGYKLWDSINKKLLWCINIFFEHQTIEGLDHIKKATSFNEKRVDLHPLSSFCDAWWTQERCTKRTSW